MVFKSTILLLLLIQSLVSSETTPREEKLTNSAVVFIYHRFGDNRYPSTNIRLEQFKHQLDYLEKHNYNVWPLSKIVHNLKNNELLPEKTVAITIDDAYKTVYTNAYPMLKEKGFPFTIFVNTNPIDNNSTNYMSWEQMRVMQEDGAEFANHTHTHDYLRSKKDENYKDFRKRVTQEIKIAQRRLKQELGSNTNENPKLLAYTFGEYNPEIIKILKSLDYVGVTQTSGAIDRFSNLYELKRFPMSEKYATPEAFITKLNTIPFAIESALPATPIIKHENPPVLTIKFKEAVSNVGCYTADGETIKTKWISEKELVVKAEEPLQEPRDRYTCTAPAKNGKWFWYSHLWIVTSD